MSRRIHLPINPEWQSAIDEALELVQKASRRMEARRRYAKDIEKMRADYARNVKQCRLSNKRSYEAHKAARAEASRAYRARHPERHRAANRAWREKHPGWWMDYKAELRKNVPRGTKKSGQPPHVS